MDSSRKASREDNETTLQYKSRQEMLLDEELIEDKLTQLLESISQLDQTPAGADEFQRRTKLFGECNRIEGGRSQISIATGRRGFLEENLSGCPEAEARAGAVIE